MAKKLPHLPKQIYVRWDRWKQYPNDPPSLTATETAQGHADLEEIRIVGRYELVAEFAFGARIDIETIGPRSGGKS
jgi:hypothetical protein